MFKISSKMGSVVAPAEELSRINAFLKNHRIALAVSAATALMEWPKVSGSSIAMYWISMPSCFSRSSWRRCGRAAIRFLANAALGSNYSKKNACHYSIDDTARRVAAAITEIRQYCPDALLEPALRPYDGDLTAGRLRTRQAVYEGQFDTPKTKRSRQVVPLSPIGG